MPADFSSSPCVLSSSPRHGIFHHKASDTPSEQLIVTFASKFEKLGDEGFGTRFALSRGYDTIYVSQTPEAWHQAVDYEEIESLILPIAYGREIIAYGSSAGAYAALYFAGVLGARVLAFAPRNDIHPVITTDPATTARDFTHKPSLNDGPLSPHTPLVVFDPYQPKDSRMVNNWLLSGYPNAELRQVIRAGHNVAGVLQEHGLLGKFAEQFFSGKIPGEIDVWEADSVNWHFTQAFRLKHQGDLDGALKHAKICQEKSPDKSILATIIAWAKELGDYATLAQAEIELAALKEKIRNNRAGRTKPTHG